jgi:hypothetical protein
LQAQAGERAFGGRQHLVGVVQVVYCLAELVHVVAAVDPRRRLADLLDGGEQQADQDGDDGDDDQQARSA